MSAANRSSREIDHIEYFLEDMTYQGKSERTCKAYQRVLREFQSFLQEPNRGPSGKATLKEASYRDCTAWIHSLRGEHADSTIATYASYLHRFYAHMNNVSVFESNPMSVVLGEIDETIEKDPVRRDLSIEEMREFIGTINHPLDLAVILALVKTGVRAGELCNIDLRDVHLENFKYDYFSATNIRSQLQGHPDSLYVSADPSRGSVTNGEVREASNKRERSTIIPIDGELKRVLHRWFAVRPDPASAANPLFMSTRSQWGERLTPVMIHHIVEDHAKGNGWYAPGGDSNENVTPHYFRHFFTTHLRDRMGDRGIVKYLRGDVADDIIDTYTHNWGDRVRGVYEANIYSLC